MTMSKYEIELPTLPLGLEIVQGGISVDGDFTPLRVNGAWYWQQIPEGGAYPILARRKRTLSDWANEQPLFKALAEMRRKIDFPTRLEHDHGEIWTGLGCTWNIVTPPDGVTGRITMKDGKWEDVP